MTSYHMNEEVLVWHQDTIEGEQFRDWETFSWALLIHFGAIAYDDPIDALGWLKQISLVSAYKAQLESLSNHLRG